MRVGMVRAKTGSAVRDKMPLRGCNEGSEMDRIWLDFASRADSSCIRIWQLQKPESKK
jgi:hypothetical protein